MERTELVILTNMCMIYDDKGNVLVEKKNEPIVDSLIREVYKETGLTITNLELCGTKH